MGAKQWRSESALRLMSETGLPTPVAAMRHKARALLEMAEVQGPPVDLELLASFRRIRVPFEYVEMTSAGRLIPTDKGNLRIQVNALHSYVQQRFTIAHEIAHTLLPTYRQTIIDDRNTGQFWYEGTDLGASQEVEALCDVGASAILMDQRWLRQYFSQGPVTMAKFLSAAQEFQSSLHAMAWAISEASDEALAFVIWQPGYRKSELRELDKRSLPGFDVAAPQKKLRVRRAYSTYAFASEIFVPYNKSISDTSPVADAISSTLQYAQGTYDFEFSRKDAPVRMHSENISVPVQGTTRVISLLKPDLPETPDIAKHVDPAHLEGFKDQNSDLPEQYD